jgi:hypothetical protein
LHCWRHQHLLPAAVHTPTLANVLNWHASDEDNDDSDDSDSDIEDDDDGEDVDDDNDDDDDDDDRRPSSVRSSHSLAKRLQIRRLSEVLSPRTSRLPGGSVGGGSGGGGDNADHGDEDDGGGGGGGRDCDGGGGGGVDGGVGDASPPPTTASRRGSDLPVVTTAVGELPADVAVDFRAQVCPSVCLCLSVHAACLRVRSVFVAPSVWPCSSCCGGRRPFCFALSSSRDVDVGGWWCWCWGCWCWWCLCLCFC